MLDEIVNHLSRSRDSSRSFDWGVVVGRVTENQKCFLCLAIVGIEEE